MSLFSMSVATPAEPPPLESIQQTGAVEAKESGVAFLELLDQAGLNARMAEEVQGRRLSHNEALQEKARLADDANRRGLQGAQDRAAESKAQAEASREGREVEKPRKRPAVKKDDRHDVTKEDLRRENIDAVTGHFPGAMGGAFLEGRLGMLSGGGHASTEGGEEPFLPMGGSGFERLMVQGAGIASAEGGGEMSLPQPTFEMLRMAQAGMAGKGVSAKGEGAETLKINAPAGLGVMAKKADGPGIKTEGMRPTLSTQSPRFADELAEKMGRLRVISRPGQSEQARIILQPKALGEIRIQMSVDEVSKVHLSISTETEAAKELLTRQISQLKEALARQDLGFAEVSVDVADREQGFSWRAHDSGESAQRRQTARRGRGGLAEGRKDGSLESVWRPQVRAGPGMSIFA